MKKHLSALLFIWLLLWSCLAFAGSHHVKPAIWACDPGTVAYNCARMGLPMPVLAMPMWEGVGNKVSDYSGNKNDGVVTNPNWQKGGLYFNGANTIINIPDNPSLDISGNKITMFAICESTGSQSDVIIMEKGGWDTGTYQIVQGGTYWKFNLSVSLDEAESGTITYNRSYRVVGLYEGTQLRIYIDGVHDTQNYEPETANIGENNGDLTIGARLGGSNYFTGWIYAVILWDCALTPFQIAVVSNNSYGVFKPIPMAWYVPNGVSTCPQIIMISQ